MSDGNPGANMTIGDILRNNVKEKLARGEVVASMTVRLVRPVEIAQIAKTAGFDTIYVDMEHCSASIETTSQICMAALAAGNAPFVRVPANTAEYIKPVLGRRTLGVIATRLQIVAEYVRMGARYVSTGTDLAFLMGACVAKAKQVRDIAL